MGGEIKRWKGKEDVGMQKKRKGKKGKRVKGWEEKMIWRDKEMEGKGSKRKMLRGMHHKGKAKKGKKGR